MIMDKTLDLPTDFLNQVAQNWQTDDLIHCRLRAAGARQVVLQPPCVTVHQNHRRHLAPCFFPGDLADGTAQDGDFP